MYARYTTDSLVNCPHSVLAKDWFVSALPKSLHLNKTKTFTKAGNIIETFTLTFFRCKRSPGSIGRPYLHPHPLHHGPFFLINLIFCIVKIPVLKDKKGKGIHIEEFEDS